ncbi:hypothetical protein IEN85_10575 [Pelagicoccus sp. NFK12]|uniref:Uncharacterized protein n=1 Tax=Pelagicoccus enzymogenes TaxID=2773457 RepID=A0A927F7L0_9BACT|nr:hypothetical protein [Pelagicoccus enzymogenes]MBD5779933.1 hypothetical protein [Pelagicoccus enzymogenes]
MENEWIDTIDTALKIGLGALIAGFFGWLGNRQNHNHELNKEQRKRRIEDLQKKEDRFVDFLSRSQNLVQSHLYTSLDAGSNEYQEYLRSFNLLQISNSDEVRMAAYNLMDATNQFAIGNKNTPDMDYQKSLRKNFDEKLGFFQKVAQLEISKTEIT